MFSSIVHIIIFIAIISRQCPYEEFIHIETGEGQFSVPIQARLPRAEISLPQSLKFGMTAVQGSLTVHFELSNIW